MSVLLKILEFLLYWDQNWPRNWGVISCALFLREVSGCSRDKRCRPPPTLVCLLGKDSWDLLPREGSSESEDTTSRRGSLLAGFFFFLLGFSCRSSRKSVVPASLVGLVRNVEFLMSMFSLESRNHGYRGLDNCCVYRKIQAKR